MKKSQHRPKTTVQANLRSKSDQSIPFGEHVRELRKRFFIVAASILVFGGITYGIEHKVIAALLKPAHGQQFIYTSPGGGVDFLFRVCLYAGIALSIPVIVYQVLKYIEPLIRQSSARFIALGSAVSGLFAIGGMVFGYFVGLPNALHFLLHQFTTQQIRPLVTIQSYMAFVSVYMLGSALLFQAPLILLFINRITPLKPSGLIKGERWVILVAFVGAGLMNPTPNIFAQLLVAGPLILMYQIGIVAIWVVNRNNKQSSTVAEMLAKEAAIREQRLAQFAANHAKVRATMKPLVEKPAKPATPLQLPRQAKPLADFGRPGVRTFSARRFA